MLNQVQLVGRLVKEPELTNISKNDTPLYRVSNSIAVVDDYNKDKSNFFSFVAWKNEAEFLSHYTHKGDLILITGELVQKTWTDEHGNNKERVEITVKKVYSLTPKKEEAPKEEDKRSIDPKKLDVTIDDELPF